MRACLANSCLHRQSDERWWQCGRDDWVLGAVTARKDDAPAADQAAINNVAAVTPFFVGGGLIQTTSG